MLNIKELSVINGIEKRKQEERIENIRVLIASGLSFKELSKRGYTIKELDFYEKNFTIEGENINMEERSIQMQRVSNGGKTVKNDKTEILPVMKRLNDDKLFKGMLLKKVENGSVTLPLIESKAINKKEIFNGVHVEMDNKNSIESYITLTPKLISVENAFSTEILNDMDQETKKVYIENSVLEVIKEISIEKVVENLNKIVPIEVNATTDIEVELFANYNPLYLGDSNFIIMNTESYKQLQRTKNAIGDSFIIKFDKDKMTNEVKPYINDVEVIVNDLATSVYLIDTKCITHVVGSANEHIEVVDSQLRRSGITAYETLVSNEFGIIDTNGITAIKLKTV